MWDEIAEGAADESTLWKQALRPEHERQLVSVFSPLADPRFAVGLETIYEGYLAHYGTPRLFAPADADVALLLGDYLYAHGLVRIAAFGETDAVADLSELISLCSQLRAENADGDGPLLAASAALLGTGRLLLGRRRCECGKLPRELVQRSRLLVARALVAGECLVEPSRAAEACVECVREELCVAKRIAYPLRRDRVLVVSGVADERPSGAVWLAVPERQVGDAIEAIGAFARRET